ncbi:hypothetical protein Pyn_34026 [Prunus yedoensis var. nudiflora]|uniref:Uncharacterized protein n=1 Tax=Prunus yedoensis var. nudiflora TaxID=2094558 RepID=A0A314URL1_PRUYE|nr:hypothetical protein Pyn_34026 [Prunus yedoensis var. nudiflora]
MIPDFDHGAERMVAGPLLLLCGFSSYVVRWSLAYGHSTVGKGCSSGHGRRTSAHN